MKKYIITLTTILILSSLGLSGFIFYQQYQFYQTHFKPETTLLGVQIGKLTVPEAEAKINRELQNKKLLFTKEMKGEVINSINKGDLVNVTKDDLTKVLKGNTVDVELTVKPDAEAKLTQMIEDINKSAVKSKNAQISKKDKSFIIEDEIFGTEINVPKIVEEVIAEVSRGTNNTDEIVLENYYVKPTVLKNDLTLKEEVDELNERIQHKLIIKIADNKEEVPVDVLLNSYTINNNQLSINKEPIKNYVKQLDDKYRTRNKVIPFKTSTGQVVNLENNIEYSWTILEDETTNKLADILVNEEFKTAPQTEAEVLVEGKGYGDKVQFGGNYVEVNLNNQEAYIYKNNEKVLSWPVITGLPNSKNRTSVGIHEILYKESPSILRGTNNDRSKYETKVNYWLPFTNWGEGIHDANWQPAFGGELYKTLGSHGCVNTDPAVMPKVFELVETKMPVVIWGNIYDGI